MTQTLNRVPAKPRSKYYTYSSSSGTVTKEANNNKSGGGGSTYVPPYTINANGDLVFDQKRMWFNDEYIDEGKIISWDEAVKLSHSHNNKTYLDKINQDLGTGRDVTFNNVSFGTLGSAIHGGGHLVGYGAGKEFWRCASDEDKMYFYKSLVMRRPINMADNIIEGINWLAFKGYAVEDEMRYNRIYDDGANGFQFSNKINLYGNLEMTGPDGLRTIYSWNDDMSLIRYDSIGNALSRLRLTNKGVEVNALNVKGSFNCYELVANKVRSTNGYLYVTDSSPILDILYYGYDGNGDAEVKVKIEDGILQQGDYVTIQKFHGNGMVRMNFVVSLVESTNTIYIVNTDGDTVDDLKGFLRINDCVVKYDSRGDESRRTGIVLSPYNGSYIDFFKGDGNGNTNKVVTSLGNLNHLDIDGVEGYGLYSDNAYLSGHIHAKTLTIDHKIKGSQIDAEGLTTGKFECVDENNNKQTTINEFGDGAIRMYANNTLTFEIASTETEVRMIYYDSNGNIKWYMGSSGTPVFSSLDTWLVRYYVPISNVQQAQTSAKLVGNKYKEFRSGGTSGNQGYNGLTAIGSVSDTTTPSSVVANKNYIPDGLYCEQGTPMLSMENDPINNNIKEVYSRTCYQFKSGKLVSKYTTTWTDNNNTLNPFRMQ